jgi:hypothetical protein
MKVFVKLFLWALILLVGGYNNIYAHQDNFVPAATKTIDQILLPGTSHVQYSLDSTIKSYNTTLKQNDKVELRDGEEDEEDMSSYKVVTAKKTLALHNYFTTDFYNYTPGYFCDALNKSLPVCKQLFHYPSNRLHIIFRVFRI